LLLIVFLTTGKFMRWDFPDKDLISPELRVLMRSRHIYILFSALLHLILGVYFQPHKQLWRKIVQILGSVLLTVSSVLLIWAFVFESYFTQHFSELSRNGIYLSLAGILLHFICKPFLNRQQ
jgi:predicted membrane protein